MHLNVSPRYFDRLLGFAFSVVGGVSLYGIHSWLNSMTFHTRDNPLNTFSGRAVCFQRLGSCSSDFQEGMKSAKKLRKVVHSGGCHCEKFKFHVSASESLNVVDYNTKLRFPRLTVANSDFEIMDNNSLSQYSVVNGCQRGTHSFCSSCGMQVFYRPSDSEEIIINADCLDRSTVREINVSYGGVWMTFPSLVPIKHEYYQQENIHGVDDIWCEKSLSSTAKSESETADLSVPTSDNDSDYDISHSSEGFHESYKDLMLEEFEQYYENDNTALDGNNNNNRQRWQNSTLIKTHENDFSLPRRNAGESLHVLSMLYDCNPLLSKSQALI